MKKILISKDLVDIIIHIVTILLLWKIYEVVKNIRKVQSGGIGDDTMSEFTSELLKGAKELGEEKKKQEKQDKENTN